MSKYKYTITELDGAFFDQRDSIKEKDRKKDDPFTYYTFEELKQTIDPQGYLSLYDEFQAISPKYSIGGKKQEDEGDINENVDKEPWYKNFFKRRLGTGRPPMSQSE